MGARTAEDWTARVRTGSAEQRVWTTDCYPFCIFVAQRLEFIFVRARPARKVHAEAPILITWNRLAREVVSYKGGLRHGSGGRSRSKRWRRMDEQGLAGQQSILLRQARDRHWRRTTDCTDGRAKSVKCFNDAQHRSEQSVVLETIACLTGCEGRIIARRYKECWQW